MKFLDRAFTTILLMLAIVLFALAFAVGVSPARAEGPRLAVFSATYDPAALVDGAGASTDVGAPGAAMGDACIASFGVSLQGILLTCYISAAGTASTRFQNETAGTVDLASSTLRVFVFPKTPR